MAGLILIYKDTLYGNRSLIIQGIDFNLWLIIIAWKIDFQEASSVHYL